MYEQIEGTLRIIRDKTGADLPASYVRVLLRIAEGDRNNKIPTMTDLATELGFSQGAISRACKYMGRWIDNGKEKGLNLIETRPDYINRKRLACSLSPEGQKLVEEIDAAIKNTVPKLIADVM